jgi:hypothetical protein
MSEKSYRKEGRLAEVLALIQVLSYDKITSRSETGLSNELQSKPATHSSWIALAKEHTEFFRVREGADEEDEKKKDLVSLVSRFVQPKVEGEKNRSPLETDVVNKLMEIAVEIHDRQSERCDRFWKLYIPIIVALLALLGKVLFG